MADNDFELEAWDNGKSVNNYASKEVQDKIKYLKEKRDFKGVL
jgi:hypothetical protein